MEYWGREGQANVVLVGACVAWMKPFHKADQTIPNTLPNVVVRPIKLMRMARSQRERRSVNGYQAHAIIAAVKLRASR